MLQAEAATPPAGSRSQHLEVIERLAAQPSARSSEQLRTFLVHPLHAVRAAALLALSRLGQPEAVRRAIEWLDSPDLQTRLDALASLAQSPMPLPKPAETKVQAQLADGRPELRLAALGVLSQRQIFVPSPVLALMAEDETAAVRVAALGAFSARQDAAARHAVVRGLRDADAGVRFAAVQAIGRLRDPLLRPVIEPLLLSTDQEIVIASAAALGQMGAPAAAAALAPLAQRPGSSRATQAAIGALGRLGTPEAARILVYRLRSFGAPDANLLSTLKALEHLGAPGEAEVLKLTESNTEAVLLTQLTVWLGKVGGAASVSPLASLVTATTPAVPAALEALKALGARGINLTRAVPNLTIALHDPSQTVRRAAASALQAAGLSPLI